MASAADPLFRGTRILCVTPPGCLPSGSRVLSSCELVSLSHAHDQECTYPAPRRRSPPLLSTASVLLFLLVLSVCVCARVCVRVCVCVLCSRAAFSCLR